MGVASQRRFDTQTRRATRTRDRNLLLRECAPDSQGLLEGAPDPRDSESDRDSEAVLRALPADPRRAREARKHRASGGLNSVFPIKDFNDTASLEFVGYVLEEPKYDVQECLQRGMTYAAPFKVTIRLVAWDESEGSQTIRDVKEQEVYFGEIPIMTDNGTFI